MTKNQSSDHGCFGPQTSAGKPCSCRSALWSRQGGLADVLARASMPALSVCASDSTTISLRTPMHSCFAGPMPCPRPDLGLDMPCLTAAGPELLRFNLNRKYTSYLFGVGGNNV